MNHCIIRSSLDLSGYLEVPSFKHNNFYYHHIEISGRNIILSDDLLKFLADNCNSTEKWLSLESEYNTNELTFDNEYFKVKDEITQNVFQGVIFDSDLELFEVRLVIIGLAKDISSKGSFSLMPVTTYKDCIMCTSYYDVNYTDVENYIKTRNNYTL